jgi:hypothetical protein
MHILPQNSICSLKQKEYKSIFICNKEASFLDLIVVNHRLIIIDILTLCSNLIHES